MSEELKKEFDNYLYVGEVLEKNGLLHEIGKYICHQEGRIHRVTSDAEARAIVETHKVSTIIIDQYLPHCSGVDFMRWLHSFAPIPAIIVIMNRNSKDTDAVVALEAGAVDAVTPDITALELAARIRVCTRKLFFGDTKMILERNELTPSRQAGKQAVYFNPETRRLYFSDASRAVLNHKEAKLLALLATSQPDYLNRETICQSIFQQAWNPNDRRIDNLVSRLRKTVDASSIKTSASAIETVRLEGYRLRLPIKLISGEKALNPPGSANTGENSKLP